MMQAEVVSIGDEITSGQTLDTNSQWISQRLEEMGVRVLFHTTVGDELDANIEVFRTAIARADVIIATGGLGPTADDLTREVLARVSGCELVQNPQALEHIRQLFARRRRPMPQQNEVQALFPAGSRMIDNPHGTAPGIAMELPRPAGSACRLFALPGVPAELKLMWNESVADALRAAGAGERILVHHVIRCFGAGESQIESMLPDLIRRGRDPRVGITASQATISLRITAEGTNRAACLAAMQPTIATIREALGSLVYGEGPDELQDAVLRILRQRSATLASAEGGTGGLVSQWLYGVDPQGQHYRGGVIVTTPPLPNAADAEQWVKTMAQRTRDQLHADYALAVGPFPPPQQPGAPAPPEALAALASVEGVRVRSVPLSLSPDLLKVYCAKQALNWFRLEVGNPQ